MLLVQNTMSYWKKTTSSSIAGKFCWIEYFKYMGVWFHLPFKFSNMFDIASLKVPPKGLRTILLQQCEFDHTSLPLFQGLWYHCSQGSQGPQFFTMFCMKLWIWKWMKDLTDLTYFNLLARRMVQPVIIYKV